jgi:uncharacterized protein YxjI
MRQRVFTFRDKFSIFDENQVAKYHVEGKLLSLTNRLEFSDEHNQVLLYAHKPIFSILAKYYIEDSNGQQLAVIKRTLGLRPKFNLQLENKMLKVSGGIFAHSFVIEDGDTLIASIQKRIISWGDTYEITVTDAYAPELSLFIVVLLDQIIHERRH